MRRIEYVWKEGYAYNFRHENVRDRQGQMISSEDHLFLIFYFKKRKIQLKKGGPEGEDFRRVDD